MFVFAPSAALICGTIELFYQKGPQTEEQYGSENSYDSDRELLNTGARYHQSGKT